MRNKKTARPQTAVEKPAVEKVSAIELKLKHPHLFEPEEVGSLVTLYKSIDWRDDTKITIGINWGACGTQGKEFTENFIFSLKIALDKLEVMTVYFKSKGFTVIEAK